MGKPTQVVVSTPTSRDGTLADLPAQLTWLRVLLQCACAQMRSMLMPPATKHSTTPTSSRWQPCSSGSGCSRRAAQTLSTRSANSASSALAAGHDAASTHMQGGTVSNPLSTTHGQPDNSRVSCQNKLQDSC